jgi:tetratricopeptide (TPR) repeat protein
MSVVNGFLIVLMILLLTYTFYRLVRKKSLLMVIPACCQVFSLAVALPGFIDNVEAIPVVQASNLLLGILLPAFFILIDYHSMVKKVKNKGIYNGLVEATLKSEPDTRCLPSEGINRPAREKQIVEIMKDLKNLPEDIQKNIRKSLNHAQSLISENKLSDAYYIYDTLAKVTGASYMLFYNAADICYRLGRYNDASESYKKALELADQASLKVQELYYNHGNTYFMLKKYEKAASSFEKALEIDPSNIPANENLAFTYVHMGEKEKGIGLLNRLKTGDGSYRASFISGRLLNDASRYQEAEAELRNCIKLQPLGIEARDELGKALLRQNKYEAALEIFEEIIKLKPDEYQAWCSRASLFSRLKRWSDAASSYSEAIKLRPDNYRNYYNMAVALEECGSWESAIEAYRNTIKVNPAFADAYNNLGIALSIAGKQQEALAVYEEGIRINRQDFSLFFNMGMNLFEAGRYIEAVASYRNALDINPKELEVYYCLGAALTELRHYNDAIEAYKSALNIKPSDGELHYNIAAIYAMLGRYDIAGENLKQAISLKEDVRSDARKNRAFDGMRGRKDFREMVS